MVRSCRYLFEGFWILFARFFHVFFTKTTNSVERIYPISVSLINSAVGFCSSTDRPADGSRWYKEEHAHWNPLGR
ncbi:hypothetical protein F0562_017750 [Nyssa sinensis]|uniref:Uncharacterized protein n=1 Tax=Nyssa sinensis TaxID=561372 RepID=A0A5J4ZJL8_9ASTE|nr:hypothetical protein F0562_017750 [Nyssa sinensis]